MDLTNLPRELVDFLVPLLPYLLEAGKKAGEEAVKRVDVDAWEWAKTLWEKLRQKAKAAPAAQEAAAAAAAAPNDDDVRAALRTQVRKLLVEDEALAREIAQLWEEAKAGGVTIIAAGERSVAAQNIQGSVITTGSQNVVQG